MRGVMIATVALTAGLCPPLASAADPVSGPQPGTTVAQFLPLNVTGPDAGDKCCLVCKYGANPVAAVFARDLTPELAQLAQKLDDATVRNADHKMGSFLVLLTDDIKQEGKLRELADDHRLKKLVLAVDAAAGPDGYDLARDAEVTVLLYV